MQEAEPFPVLKIKVGLTTDEATIAAVRSVTKKPLRVDANEGWTNKEEAVRKINWLESQGVEFVEQPMPAEMIEETRWVRSHVHLPIIADEAAVNARAIPKLVDAYDGVNVKLDKCGGIQQALRMIYVAKSFRDEDHAGLHGFQFRECYGGSTSVAARRLCRSRREPARRERSLPRRHCTKGQAGPARRLGSRS